MPVEPGPFARELFDSISSAYDLPAEVLSFGRYRAWRRALVGSLGIPHDALVLDVATGTGLIGRAIAARDEARVVGLDQSLGMLAAASRRGHIRLVAGDANALPFPDSSFDTVVFSYLLRYVADPSATVRELARVLRPGGVLASVEFGVPEAAIPRLGWRAWALLLFPLAARPLGPGWSRVGKFLGPNIRDWAATWPVDRQARVWRDAGVKDVRVRRMTLGAGVLMRGRRA